MPGIPVMPELDLASRKIGLQTLLLSIADQVQNDVRASYYIAGRF